jgi:hypothetical protein
MTEKRTVASLVASTPKFVTLKSAALLNNKKSKPFNVQLGKHIGGKE